ncbi:MAG: hypothetical protein HFI33_04300 [Lachnospiraceae bacterium]|nr:hypothetical protein [Lachnospiraceae bacterium]
MRRVSSRRFTIGNRRYFLKETSDPQKRKMRGKGEALKKGDIPKWYVLFLSEKRWAMPFPLTGKRE